MACRFLLGLVVLLCSVALRADDPLPPRGTELGNYVPTTTTWVVTAANAKFEGRNTCLAGVNRDRKVISVYCRGESAALWSLLKLLDDGLKDRADLEAYVVIHIPLFDEAGYNRSAERFETMQRMARQKELKRVAVSLSRQGDSDRLLPISVPLRIVYSDRRIVKLSEDFPKIGLEPEQARKLLERILSLAKD